MKSQVILFAALIALSAPAAPALAQGPTEVHLKNHRFTPNVINVGTVLIVVRNSDPGVAHQIGINGVYSTWMGPNGGTSVMKVTFKRPGTYVAGTFGGFPPDGGETGGEGVLKVLKK